MFRMSGLKSRDAAVAVGRSILIDCSLIIVRLAIMNEASRKNMMSISGMISIRAFLCGRGEPIFMAGHSAGKPDALQRLREIARRTMNAPAFGVRGACSRFRMGDSWKGLFRLAHALGP